MWNFLQGTCFGFPVSGFEGSGIFKIELLSANTILTGGTFGLEASIFSLPMLLIIFVMQQFSHKPLKKRAAFG